MPKDEQKVDSGNGEDRRDPRDRFKDLAPKRVNKVLDALTVLGNYYGGQLGQSSAAAVPAPPYTRDVVEDQGVSGANVLTRWVHVFDEEGQLVAQRDVMHQDGGWPTTCWRPGEPFEDRYTLVQLESMKPGLHRVEVGLYWLPSGERLPVTGQGAQAHRAVAIGTIEVKAQE